jgi:hypothetical protein
VATKSATDQQQARYVNDNVGLVLALALADLWMSFYAQPKVKNILRLVFLSKSINLFP